MLVTAIPSILATLLGEVVLDAGDILIGARSWGGRCASRPRAGALGVGGHLGAVVREMTDNVARSGSMERWNTNGSRAVSVRRQ